MADIDNLVIKISSDASEAVKGIKDLARGLADTASQCSRAANSLKDVAKSTKDVGEASAEAADSTGKLEEEAKETSKVFTRAGGLSEAVRRYAQELRNTSKEAEHATSKFEMFLSSIKRIAMYRAIRSALKMITQALKEGFEMFLTWDRESNNGLAGVAGNVEALKEKWTMLKGSIGALLGSLANGFIPIINGIIDGLTQVVDLLQMVFRSLQGEYTYYKLIYKSAKATTATAKELKRVLFGFDELNVLPSQSGGGLKTESGSWDFDPVPISSKFLNSIADASNKIREWLGLTKDQQNGLGLLTGAIGLLLGGKALGALIGWALPNVLSLFKKKNSALGDQTSKVTADATATEGLATQFGSATGKATGLITAITLLGTALLGSKRSAQELNAYTQANPIVVKTAADLGGIKSVATGLAATQTVLNANPLTISLYAPLAAIANAFVEFRNSIQSLFNRNPINIAMKVASGGVVGAGSYIKSLGVANASVGGSKVTAKDVEAQIQQTLLQYESDLWNQGGTLGKAVGTFGGAALITAVTGGIASILTSSGALAEILSLLGLAGAFAGGGTPDTGSLFWAGEHGAELVTHASGGTEVLNGNQVQVAMENANLEVVNAVYAMANMVSSAINNKDFDVYMDSAKVGHSVSKYQYNQARRGVTQGAY